MQESVRAEDAAETGPAWRAPELNKSGKGQLRAGTSGSTSTWLSSFGLYRLCRLARSQEAGMGWVLVGFRGEIAVIVGRQLSYDYCR